TEAKKSVKLLNNKGGDFANWTRGNYFCENPAKKDVTDMGVWSSFGGWLGTLPSGYTDTSNSPSGGYFGAIQEFILPEQATDWYLWARAWFETGRMGQTGAWALTVIDQDNHLIAGMVLEKYDRVGNTALCSFLIGDNGGSLVKKTIQFTPHYWIDRNNSNPYGSESRDQNRNMFDLKKTSDKVTYYWYGTHYTYSDSRLRDKKATKIQFFVGQMAGRNTTNQLVTHHYLSDLSFTKLNVPYWVDVPNRFPAGANMYVDGEKGNLYVNNLISHDDEVVGTDYFHAPPGETTIQLYVSSFSEIEMATAEIKEAYI
ncbi:phage tail family protein, partial [Enterococcus cecorum]|nr:phage tail family protein [Enterococcus cecorum]